MLIKVVIPMLTMNVTLRNHKCNDLAAGCDITDILFVFSSLYSLTHFSTNIFIY